MKMVTLAVLLLSASSLFAQTAKVIPLKDADTKELQKQWNTLQQAQKDWDALNERIRKDYTVVLETDPDKGNVNVESVYYPKSGPISGVSSWAVTTSDCNVADLTYPPKVDKEKQERCAKEDAENQKKYQETYKTEHYYRAGWESGVVFDKDFKFIVPKPYPTGTVSPGNWSPATPNWNGIYVQPDTWLCAGTGSGEHCSPDLNPISPVFQYCSGSNCGIGFLSTTPGDYMYFEDGLYHGPYNVTDGMTILN